MGLWLPLLETDPETYSIVGSSIDNSSSRTDAMQPMPQANAMNLKSHKSVLLGTSALVCLALAAPVLAADFVITSGTTTNDGNTINAGDTVTVTGALTTTAANEGIETTGGTNKVTVSEAGSITTGTGAYAFGIYNNGSTNTTTVSGSITTAGSTASGIYNEGAFNTTTVSGSITTAGYGAHGIINRGSTNTTTVSEAGSIKTTGNQSIGININGDNNTTTVSGSIKTEGAGAHGIYNFGDNNKTTVSGTVKATGARSAALYNVIGDGNSFTLNEGAIIIGDIVARDATNNAYDATNSKLIFNLGASTSYAYSVSGKGEGAGAGMWTFSDLDGPTQGITTTGTGCDTTITGAGNTVCNLVTGVSTGNLEVQDELQFSMNSSMIGSLSLGSSNSTAPVEAMSFAQTPQNNA